MYFNFDNYLNSTTSWFSKKEWARGSLVVIKCTPLYNSTIILVSVTLLGVIN